MKNRYKVIISGKNLYKEIELAPEMHELRLGTAPECDVKLRREMFFVPIELVFSETGSGWNISCADNLYLTTGGVRKILAKNLSHGDELILRYQDSDSEIMTISFMIDFEYEGKDYDLKIDISGKRQITIGGRRDCDIYLSDPYLGTDLLSVESGGGTMRINDNNSRYGVFVNGRRINKSAALKNRDFFSIACFSFYYKDGALYTSAGNNLALNTLRAEPAGYQSTHFKYPEFIRNARIQYIIPDDDLEISQAAQRREQPKKNLLLTLIPSIIMFAMVIVLRGIMGSGGTFVIYSAVCMGMGIITSVITYFKEKKDYEEEAKKRIENYEEYIEEKKQVIEASRVNELRIRDLIYVALENSMEEIGSFGKRLFERSPEDADFLQIYLGRGRIESANPVSYNKPEFADKEDPLFDIPEKVTESYRYIEDAPVVSDFRSSGCIGITGSRSGLKEILKNITLDLTARHFYSDVKLVYIFDPDTAGAFSWVRWLHNVENSRLQIRNIACDEESRNIILEDLYINLSSRKNAKGEEGQKAAGEQYVVFVTDTASVRTHPISKYFEGCSGYGFTFVFLEEYEEFLPHGCGEIIRIFNDQRGEILNTGNGDMISGFRFPLIPDALAEEAALKLGGITVDEVTLEGELTKNITMFEMLGILSAADLDLASRWENSQVYKSLAAPLGVKAKNKIMTLDLSDKSGAHGPHGLVAGTTGSGKSEVLQTYILSMATLFHPYEVGFVIIDFKGGGMANQFKDLPHLIGTITNIDGREINRSLLSIKAELVKRQEMFSKSGVNHINDYIKLYKAGKVCAPMPHLIIIVDEFAELKQEYPDFMKELISAARIGRTLGVHLILATQKPAGVVDSQIWSNSKFRICLKVQTKEDSKEVIKTPLAAEIVEAGRGYFQVGSNEIFDLFQSAYSGAPVPSGNDNKDKIFAVYEKSLSGKRVLKYTNKPSGKTEESMSQLEAIVSHVHDYCAGCGIKKLPGICLPPLEDRISVGDLVYENDDPAVISVPVGIFDDPEQQRQGAAEIRISGDNLYIVGSSQMGKTVLIQTLVYGLIKKYTPEQINIYLADCGSMVLKLFEESAHVGGVVLSNEEEKCRNLFKLINNLVQERKKILSDRGAGNYAAYLEAGYTDIPMVVVIIDNMAAFKEFFPDQAETINSLSREAIGVGVSFVITASASNTLNYRTQANFGTKLVLNCNDTNEYSAVLGRNKTVPKNTPGRGLLMLEKRILEFQTAIFGKSEKEAMRNQEFREFILERNSHCTSKAPAIPTVPEKLVLKTAMEDAPSVFRTPGVFPLGMDFVSVDYTFIDIFSSGSLTLLGNGECKTTFTVNLMNMIAQTIIFHNIEAFIVDDKTAKLDFCSRLGYVKKYVSDTPRGLETVEDFCDEAERLADSEAGGSETRMILVINSQDVFRKICADKNACRHLAETLRNAGDSNVFILIAAVEDQPVGFNSSDVLKVLKEERQAVLFGQITENKFFDVSGRIKEDPNFDRSMAFRFNAGTYSKIKLFE